MDKKFHKKIFSTVEEVEKILPSSPAGVVVIEDKKGLRIHGGIFTEADGNIKEVLDSARIGAQNLNPKQKISVIEKFWWH